jgi:Domain of unknown function (DUF4430)
VHRSLVWLGIVVAALALAAPALAVKVHVRVESANTTVWGAKEPWVTPVGGTIQPPSGDPITVGANTAFGALERASQRGEFFYATLTFSFGSFVDQIGRLGGTASTGWVYKVNGISPPVGATDYVLKEGDRVLWYYAKFGPTGGPKTLVIEKRRRPKLCFTARQQDDAGVKSAVGDVVFRVNGHAVRSKSGTFCPKGLMRTIRVSKAGLVRSVLLAGAQAR